MYILSRLFLLLALFPIGAVSYEAVEVHQHYSKWEGVLPCPYDSVLFEIRLDPETDDATEFSLVIGGAPVEFRAADLKKLQNLELGTMQALEEIYRDSSESCESFENLTDIFYISIEAGERYRIEWDDNGETKYLWGYDMVVIKVVNGIHGKIELRKLGRGIEIL